MKHVSLILIDPQVGFCSPYGSLGLSYGTEELSEIDKVIPGIKMALSESYRRHLVKSEYGVGQFTNADFEHPLANLCVPSINDDCKVIDALSSINYHSSTTKHQRSAMSCKGFRSEIENDLELGIRHFVLAGFLLEHCVKSTAIDLFDSLSGSDAEVSVCSDLSASRVQKYTNGTAADTAKALHDLGIKFKSWQSIRG
ncbi:MAG: isochorismatase family protein [Pseudomonadales bacterium]|nr:isochorismatase family protein [Pseudomonadales bacterium]